MDPFSFRRRWNHLSFREVCWCSRELRFADSGVPFGAFIQEEENDELFIQIKCIKPHQNRSNLLSKFIAQNEPSAGRIIQEQLEKPFEASDGSFQENRGNRMNEMIRFIDDYNDQLKGRILTMIGIVP